MPEPVDAAIEKALLDKAIAFATAQSPPLRISVQNGLAADGKPFQPPANAPTAQWLKAAVLPAPPRILGIAFDADVQHYGLLQIDVVQGVGGGTVPMKRLVSAIRDFFTMGLILTQDDFNVEVQPHSMQAVAPSPLIEESPGWVKIAVSIPWLCFERPA